MVSFTKKLGDIAFITKLAGFEHTKYIQGNCSHTKIDETYIPLFIGKTIHDGKIDTNFDWYISKSISDELPRSKLDKKCLIVPYVGSLGDIAIFPATYDAHLGSNVGKIELLDNCGYSEEFIYYYLKSPIGQQYLLKEEQGGVQKNITMEAIRNVLLPDSDLPTQKRIADVLSCIDDKIALNNKTNNELENMAKTVYDYWFTQFDFPDANGRPYKASGGKMEYNQVLKREIPAGWENGCFGDLIEIGNGKDHSKLAEGDIPVYGSGGFMRTVEKALYEGESVLFPRKGTLNNVMYVNESFWTVDTMFYSIPKIENVPLYVFYNAKHFDFEKMNTGTGVPSMTSSIIKELPIVIPDSNVLKNFNDKVQPIYHQIFRNQKETEELTKLRDFLLPLLMNGQIEVR